MSETKTYKNPDILAFSDGSGWRITSEGVTEYSDSYKWFRSDEWDMEITFTKKAKPFVRNDVVLDQYGNQGRVIAVDHDLAWVNYYLNSDGDTVDYNDVDTVSMLKHA